MDSLLVGWDATPLSIDCQTDVCECPVHLGQGHTSFVPSVQIDEHLQSRPIIIVPIEDTPFHLRRLTVAKSSLRSFARSPADPIQAPDPQT